nr:MAG TPA: hypothetical protein [Caudoviricetes sp.]
MFEITLRHKKVGRLYKPTYSTFLFFFFLTKG